MLVDDAVNVGKEAEHGETNMISEFDDNREEEDSTVIIK